MKPVIALTLIGIVLQAFALLLTHDVLAVAVGGCALMLKIVAVFKMEGY